MHTSSVTTATVFFQSHPGSNSISIKIKWCVITGIVHPQRKILSFTHPLVVPNLYECLCSAEHKERYFEESLSPGSFGAPLTSIVGQKKTLWKSMMSQNCSFSHNVQNIFLCVQQKTRHSYRSGTTGWVNDDRIFNFGWTIPLRLPAL